ncbi:MAG: hypothetical protein ACXWUR_06810 [Allosphingosinicella sp.]
MKIELACKVCGNNRFALAQVTSDDALVRCDDCGHEIGSLRALKEEVARIVLSRAADRRVTPA